MNQKSPPTNNKAKACPTTIDLIAYIYYLFILLVVVLLIEYYYLNLQEKKRLCIMGDSYGGGGGGVSVILNVPKDDDLLVLAEQLKLKKHHPSIPNLPFQLPDVGRNIQVTTYLLQFYPSSCH